MPQRLPSLEPVATWIPFRASLPDASAHNAVSDVSSGGHAYGPYDDRDEHPEQEPGAGLLEHGPKVPTVITVSGPFCVFGADRQIAPVRRPNRGVTVTSRTAG